MAEENDPTKNLKTTSPSEDEVPEELKGKVLVPKIGHEQKFVEALMAAERVAHGALGWKGMADIMFECGGMGILSAGEVEVAPNWTDEQHKAVIEEYLKAAHFQSIMDYAEWVTEEEAEKRRRAQEVLFSHKDHGNGD